MCMTVLSHTHTRANAYAPLYCTCTKMPKQASQPGSWLQPLPICVLQIGIWIKWSLRCPEGGKRRQSLTWPDLLPEQTFKMRINFRGGGGGGGGCGGAGEGDVEEAAEKSSASVF